MAEQTAGAPTVEDTAANAAATANPNHPATEATEAAGGLPQFEFQHWAGQIAYLAVLFAILYVLMSRVFAPRIRRVVEERRETIDGALDAAKAVRTEADAQAELARKAVAEAKAAAQKTALDAKTKAEAEAAKRQAALEADLSQKLDAAEDRIRQARDGAMASVGAVATDTAQAIVQKLTGVAAPKADLDAALAKVQG